MNTQKYQIIYADPPWSYSQKSAGRGNKSGAKDKYKTMSLADIMAMPISNISSENSILFLWGTVPLLPQAIKVLEAWGFDYKTKITWEKTGCLGMGNWMRIQEEYILVGIKGKVKPFGCQLRSIIKHSICAHSAKPHYFRQLVETLGNKSFESPSKIELFARSREGFFPDYEYEGWDVWGNQVNNCQPIFTNENTAA